MKVKVKVGHDYPDGTFKGEEVEFEGREVGVWEGPLRPPLDPTDLWLVTKRLYECQDGYRVHETIRSASEDPYDSQTDFALYPVVGHWGYGTYTEKEAREKWGTFFEVL